MLFICESYGFHIEKKHKHDYVSFKLITFYLIRQITQQRKQYYKHIAQHIELNFSIYSKRKKTPPQHILQEKIQAKVPAYSCLQYKCRTIICQSVCVCVCVCVRERTRARRMCVHAHVGVHMHMHACMLLCLGMCTCMYISSDYVYMQEQHVGNMYLRLDLSIISPAFTK